MSIDRISRSNPLLAFAVCTALAFLLTPEASTLEVDRTELEKSGRERIVFINYEGPHARIDSLEDIFGIGTELGRAVKNGATRAGDSRRYYAIHSVSPSAAGGTGLDADVIGLGVDAGVDHIRNLRLIIQGFLQAAYDYSRADAALLAEFATVYNAVHRGDWSYYETRYKAQVASSLEKTKVGLSVRFDEWPGRAMIVIPLSEGAKPGSLSAVDTTPLTEKTVVEELRKKEDLGVQSRKEMVDLKEREASEARQKAELEREAIVEEEKKLAEEKAAIQAERERIAAAGAAAVPAEVPGSEALGAVQTDGRTEAAQASTAGRQQAAAAGAASAAAPASGEGARAAEASATEAAAEKALAEREAAVAEKEADLEQRKEDAAKTEALADKKEAEAVAERTDIAKDQQELIKKEDAAVPQPKGELSLRMVSADGPFARFVLLDLTTGKEVKVSALDTVRSRSVAEAGGRLVAVAGRPGGNGAIRLVAVDKASLEMLGQGEDDMHPESPVWVNGETIYALSLAGGSIRLASFGVDLKRKALSAAILHPYAALRFAPGTVLTQAADGSALMLKDTDLSTLGR